MECTFEETIDLPGGGYQTSKCINKADILIIADPCYGLCYTCAYRKLKSENKGLKAAVLWSEKFDGNITVKDMREFLETLKGS